ncbi:hypothetical protein CHARACLAT_032242 [Characodon lateralis]|uniref:Uncharacterized protein n=1 Tax=Characodon lateralis TaxID=208331 RepID=A0ABU7EYK1_9TELE|nr:hypothetical protein [Characodon lateralis]
MQTLAFCLGDFPGMHSGLMSWSSQGSYRSHEVTTEDRSRTEAQEANMLHLVGIVAGLLFVVICFSKGLKEGKKPQVPESSSNSKLNDLSEEDVHLLAKILSLGLVDADPNYLHHLKGYRDLRGG